MKRMRIWGKWMALPILVLLLCGSLAACSEEAPARFLEPAQLTKEEKDIISLLGLDGEQHIFDFTVDETIQSLQINTYRLEDGVWKLVSGGGGRAFSDPSGRIALSFDRISQGLRTAVQSHNSGGSNAFHAADTTPPEGTEAAEMGVATSLLSERRDIVYEQEIPLAVQIVTNQTEIHSYMVEYFFSPEEYEKHGYEEVTAITVRFSQKTVAELAEQTDG